MPPAAGGFPQGAQPGFRPVVYTGRVAELFALSLVNLLLKVVTLGIYYFWAKTRVRRYVWSHTLYEGEAFEYTGRGIELLRGYVLAMAVLIPLLLALEYAPAFAPRYPLLALAGLASMPLMLFLTGFATFSSRRYLLGRTRWRGIRFAMAGRARDHGLLTLVNSLLTSVTLGFYLPFMRNRLMGHLINHARFGNERFRYDGPDGPLLRRYLLFGAMLVGALLLWGLVAGIAIPASTRFLRGPEPLGALQLLPAILGFAAMLLLVPTFALGWLWYRAGELRHFVGHTRLADARFELALSTRRYMALHAVNVIALFGTLGMAYPWVVTRTARTLAGHLRMDGVLDVEAILQSALDAPRTGEGLAEALDLGSI